MNGSLGELFQSPSPWIIAHRGDSHNFPENSLSAFHSAIEKGADMIELDVRMSLDRVPMVIHDNTLDRTTNGQGPVSSMDFSQLQQLDNGSWMNPRYSNDSLPTLKKVLDLVSGKIALNIEIKASEYEPEDSNDVSIESEVCEMVHQHDCQNQVVVSSFEHRCLTRINRHPKKIPVAPLQDSPTSASELIKLVQKHQAFSCHVNEVHLDEEIVNELTNQGIVLLAYTVNDRARFNLLSSWGITGIITDDPGMW